MTDTDPKQGLIQTGADRIRDNDISGLHAE